jgi:hypothetical protein
MLLGFALCGGLAHAESENSATAASAEGYMPIPLPEPISFGSQVQSLFRRAGAKVPSDADVYAQQGHDQLLELLRSHPDDAIRAKAGSLLIRHRLLLPASLEMLVPLFERISTARAWERNHLPRGWLELREAGSAIQLRHPERMAALPYPSDTEDKESIEGMRDAILGLHGDLEAVRRLRDALLQCVADEAETVDCLDSAPIKGLATLALIQERWDSVSPEQRAALIRWAHPEPALLEFALTEISGVTHPTLRSSLIDVALPLLNRDGLQRLLEESVQLVAKSGRNLESVRDVRGLPLACSDGVPLLDHLSSHWDQLRPDQRATLADQMIAAAVESPEPLRACLLQMAVTYDPAREKMIHAELAARRESDGNPSVHALAALYASDGAEEWLVKSVILRGSAEKWLLVTQQMPDEQWERLIDSVLIRLEDFPKYAAEYFALMPHEVQRGETIEPPPLLKAEIRGQEAALRQIQQLAPERMPALAQRFEAQGTDAARFIALGIWSDASEDPASTPHRLRLGEALLTAQHPNLRKFGAEELAKLDAGTP